MKRIRKYQKFIAAFMLVTFIMTYANVPKALAITGHDSMPEYRSFEPVATTNMVNMFDGSFTYNIPLLEVPNGYPINLSYHSNEINNESQASWVGMGWSLNPGAINRVKRGFPDDFNGESVTYHNKMPKNWTVTGGVNVSKEFFGNEAKKNSGLDLSLGATMSFNNYTGISQSLTGGIGLPGGIASMNFSYSAGRFGFNPQINPLGLFHSASIAVKNMGRKGSRTNEDRLSQKKARIERKDKRRADKTSGKSVTQADAGSTESVQVHFIRKPRSSGSRFSAFAPQERSYSTNVSPYSGSGFNLKFDVGFSNAPALEGVEGTFSGSYVQKTNSPVNTHSVYGYMNSENASSDSQGMMDYYTENEKLYQKRDKYMGVPLPNYDMFSLSGEALGGSFRPFRSDVGHYRKNEAISEMNTGGLSSLDFSAGSGALGPIIYTSVSTGADINKNYNFTKVGDWTDGLKGDIDSYKFRGKSSFENGSNESVVLRFNGDKAGNFEQSESDLPERATLKPVLLGATREASIDINSSQVAALNERTLRSSYISMTRNEEILASDNITSAENVAFRAHQNELTILNQNGTPIDFDRSNYGNDNGIGEIVTYNGDGVKYTYGLPLHSKNERQLSYSLEDDQITLESGLVATVNQNIDDNDVKRKLGYETPSAYATQFLLTQITDADYIDRTYNGLTPDDFGNFTRFNYQQFAGGSANSWYGFKSPYRGLSYSFGSLSDKNDNSGDFSSGEKELNYLQSVLSKTHVAIFTTSERLDGQSIPETNDINEIIRGTGGATMPLRKLDRIDLYSIEDCELIDENHPGLYQAKPGATAIKTVRFEYDYELAKGTPNSLDANGGRLTLKRLWFEYEGKKTSKISPYEFEYKYPQSSEINYPDKYDHFLSEFGDNFIESNGFDPQNPDYDVLNTDRWGCYRDFSGMEQTFGDLAKFFPYMNQEPSLTQFDPAAWCLKRIHLPSGGEIHIQYEQSDYQYVQDKRAMVMVPLLDENDDPVGTRHKEKGTDDNSSYKKKRYYIDINKIGINYSDFETKTRDEKIQIVEDIFEPLRNTDERMFFHFLYTLLGNDDPNFSSTNAEFLEGYARIAGYGFDQNRIFLVFKHDDGNNNLNNSSPSDSYYFKVNHDERFTKFEIPRKVCKDFYLNQRRGLVSDGDTPVGGVNDDDQEVINSAVSIVSSTLGLDKVSGICRQMSPKMSYVRLQLPAMKKKRGGGCRVKRLLMFDDGLSTTGRAVLYGNEYNYNTKLDDNDPNSPIISSGVATMEPSVGRRECALVQPLEKERQSRFEALLFGRDMYGQEGPIAESMYPSPSVGYSKVTVSNIHTGRTSTGFEVHEFYTCKDFPVEVLNTDLDDKYSDPIPPSFLGGFEVGGVGINISRATPHLAQGYSVILNEMNGQPKRIGKYAANSNRPISEESYTYYELGEKVPVMNEDLSISQENIGKESEVLAESRRVNDISIGGSVATDITVGIVTLPPFLPPTPYVFPSVKPTGVTYVQNTLKTHVTTKITTYPAIVKRVVNYTDGVKHITENSVFDKYTGNPVVIKTWDDFNEPYTNQDFMASWYNKGMRSKALNEGLILYGTFQTDPELNTSFIEFTLPGASCDALEKFAPGDLLAIQAVGGSGVPALYHSDEPDFENNRLAILTSALNENTGLNSNTAVRIEIVKSGYTNEVNLKTGNVLAHGNSIPFTQTPATVSEVQPLLDLLNNQLPNGGTIARNTLPANVNVIDPETGQCVAGNNFPWDIEVGVNQDDVTFNIKGDDIITNVFRYCNADPNVPPTTHPLVDHLNNYMDAIWALNISQTNNFSSECINPSPSNVISRKIDLNSTNLVEFETIRDSYFNSSQIFECIDGTPQSIPITNLLTSDENSINNLVDLYDLDGSGLFKLYNFRIQRSPSQRVVQTLVNNECGPNYINSFSVKNLPLQSLGTGITATSEIALNGVYTENVGRFDINSLGELTFKQGDSWPFSLNIGEQPTLGIRFGYTEEVSSPNIICNQTIPLVGDFNDQSQISFSLQPDQFKCLQNLVITNESTSGVGDMLGESNYQVFVDGVNELEGQFKLDGGKSTTISIGSLLSVTPKDLKIIVDQRPGNSSTAAVIEVDDLVQCGNGPISSENSSTESTGLSLPTDDLQFSYDEATGLIMLEAGTCKKAITCLKVCSSTNTDLLASNIVSATAATFDHVWPFDASHYPQDQDLEYSLINNDYETGTKGNWRVKDQFVYREVLNSNGETRNFEKGKFDFQLFNWRDQSQNDTDRWLLTTSITKYNPNGDAIEDRNILDIYSTAKFGYNATLPVLVAQNAEDHSVAFEGFERQYFDGAFMEDGIAFNASAGTIDNTIAHTGTQSVIMKRGVPFTLAKINVTEQVTSEGVLVKAWFRNSSGTDALNGKLHVHYAGNEVDMVKLSSAGEWELYEALITSNLTLGQSDFAIELDASFVGVAHMDDVRFQPNESEMVCYVYDKAQRLVAVFDDWHYAMVYEYNTEGLLVRKVKETVNGLRTVSETQYNTTGKERKDYFNGN